MSKSWRGSRVALAVTGVVSLFGLMGPWVSPTDPRALVGPIYGPPQVGAPLGYDYLGHDVWARVLSGGRPILWMSLSASILALLVGTALGLVAGYSSRWVDQVVVFGVDVFHAFPNLILVLLIVSILGREPWLIVATAASALVPGVVRLVRGLTVRVATLEFIEAAEIMGYPRWRIRLLEILPNISAPLLVHLGTMVSWAVGILSALSFLGYGVAPPAADWGLMINENRLGLSLQPWAVIVPTALIAALALGTNLLAESLGRVSSPLGDKEI